MFLRKIKYEFDIEDEVILEDNSKLNISCGDIGIIKEVYIFNNVETYVVKLEKYDLPVILDNLDILCIA